MENYGVIILSVLGIVIVIVTAIILVLFIRSSGFEPTADKVKQLEKINKILKPFGLVMT